VRKIYQNLGEVVAEKRIKH